MLGTISRAGVGAINLDGKFAVTNPTDGKSAVDDENWFSAAARQLYPSKAGAALHYLTGFDERLCQRYAEHGEKPTKPSAYFLRKLLRGAHGSQWLAAIMDGCEQPWWRDLQRHRKIGSDTERAVSEAQAQFQF